MAEEMQGSGSGPYEGICRYTQKITSCFGLDEDPGVEISAGHRGACLFVCVHVHVGLQLPCVFVRQRAPVSVSVRGSVLRSPCAGLCAPFSICMQGSVLWSPSVRAGMPTLVSVCMQGCLWGLCVEELFVCEVCSDCPTSVIPERGNTLRKSHKANYPIFWRQWKFYVDL